MRARTDAKGRRDEALSGEKSQHGIEAEVLPPLRREKQAEQMGGHHVLELSEMTLKGRVLESSGMALKDDLQWQSLLVKLGFLSCCLQWSGFSTWGMSLLYGVLSGFISGQSR